MLILAHDYRCSVSISYVVVAQHFRGQKTIGHTLVRHIQSQADIVSICAEARNEYSERMLINCGFHRSGEDSVAGCPILIWERAVKNPRTRRTKGRSPMNGGVRV